MYSGYPRPFNKLNKSGMNKNHIKYIKKTPEFNFDSALGHKLKAPTIKK